MTTYQTLIESVRTIFDTPADVSDKIRLNGALRLLSKWRSTLFQQTLVAEGGTTVLEGPFAGLEFNSKSTEGCHAPKLLGCYEQPLHAEIERVIARGYDLIVNIGCAEGYYAVGLARRMPQTKVLAYDLNPQAQRSCAELAEKNGVAARVSVGGEFTKEDFGRLPQGRILVVCDIEGAEVDLLDPAQAPALRDMDVIVESHDVLKPGTTDLLAARFAPSHSIETILDDGHRVLANPPQWYLALSHLDQLLGFWEWRSGPTPWLIMHAHSGRRNRG